VQLTADQKALTEEVAPTEVEQGDLVVEGSRVLRVTGEPQTMHSGLGLFDDFRIMIRAEVEDVDNGHYCTRVWGLDAVIVRHVRRQPSDSA
jgi:hypothetical protein